MSNDYEFMSKTSDESQDLDYEEVSNAVFGGDNYDYEIKRVSKKVKKKLKKYLKKQTPKPEKIKKVKKKILKLEGELAKIKKEQRRNKLGELINCDSVAERKRLAKELFEEVS